MKSGRSRIVFCATRAALLCLLGVAWASAQAEPEQKAEMSDTVFKNVQVLKGIPVDQFMGTMGFFAASLGLNCTDCHAAESAGNWQRFADDTPLKQTARQMILMTNAINKGNFGGARMVTCYSCHRGNELPEITPSLAQQYGTPPPNDPDKAEIPAQAPAGPSADQILDKYIQAIGGARQLANLKSFVAKGTYIGYDTDQQKVPLDLYAHAPNQRTTVVHTLIGDTTTAYDGRAGWIAAKDKPVPLLALTGGDLNGVQVDADLSFPARIKEDFTKWRAGFPVITIDGREVQIVEAETARGSRVKLYFDKQSGLLVRQVRYNETLVGINPTHIEYSDYRTVAGVLVPFHWVVTWTDGQATIQLTEVQPNAAIDPAKFAKPFPAPPPKVTAK
jgi:photosynthetic reaction center cytochrome c subunit